MSKNYIDVIPRPKMGESLRSLGYNVKSATADIMDNSIDAGATEIQIEASGKKNQRDPVSEISIFDNGCGMTGEQLNEALTLGTESDKSVSSLGCFGMGLKTAGTSLGRCITVITRCEGGETVCRVYDLDVNQVEGKFVVEDREPTESELSRFNDFVGIDGTGTCVHITKVDSTEHANVKSFLAALKAQKSLRLIFRKFLDSNTCNISVNSTVLRPWGYDYVEDAKTIRGPSSFILKDGTHLGTIKIVNTLETEHKPGHSREQGLVVVRNNRDITTNKINWHDVHSHNWELSGIYLIWEVNASVFDPLMGTTLMKDGWNLPQNVKDQLTAEIAADLRSHIKQRQTLRKANQKKDNSSFEEATNSYNKNLNVNMNVTAKAEVHNNEKNISAEETVPGGKKTKKKEETEEAKKKRKPFRYAHGRDEWIIEIDPGCGDGRHYQVTAQRGHRGGRRFILSVDTNHPWVAKYFLSDLASNSPAMYMAYDALVGDAYMEFRIADVEVADQAIRAKSDFLRTRAKVTTAHDEAPNQVMAAK
jgi:hypothetical protein